MLNYKNSLLWGIILGGATVPQGFHGYRQIPTKFKLNMEWYSTSPCTTQLQNAPLVNWQHLWAKENRWHVKVHGLGCWMKMEEKRGAGHTFSWMLLPGELQGVEKTREEARRYIHMCVSSVLGALMPDALLTHKLYLLWSVSAKEIWGLNITFSRPVLCQKTPSKCILN